MSSFTVGGTEATFTLTEEQFSDKGGLLEEIQAKLIADDPLNWSALLALLTPRELVSIRTSRALVGGAPTIIIDLGGGAGTGTLVLDDYTTLIAATALLIDVASDAPIGEPGLGSRAVKATWLIIPA